MRKIIVGAQVSIDGVMQAPGGPTEDPTKGFKFGGWAMFWAFSYSMGVPCGRSNQLITYFIGILLD